MGRAISLIAALAASACAAPTDATGTLSVRLRTGFLPGAEFTSVTTEAVGADADMRWFESTLVGPSADVADRGVVVARFDAVPGGALNMTVNLLDAAGRLVGRRELSFDVAGDAEYRVEIARASCEGTTCEGGRSCLNGECVASACIVAPELDACGPVSPTADRGRAPGSACAEAGLTERCGATLCDGLRTCSAERTWTACVPIVTDEVCDGADNNCDGELDNLAAEACTTACGEGTYVCSGAAQVCDARAPMDEILNALDDDCDGHTDETDWVHPYRVAFSALGGGCDSAFDSKAACQAAADAWCREQSAHYVGGFGPVDSDGTRAWVACVATGSGARRFTVAPSELHESVTADNARSFIATHAYTAVFCAARGYDATPGPVAWADDNTRMDVLCMPAEAGAFELVESTPIPRQLLVDRGCPLLTDGAWVDTQSCAAAAQKYCVDMGWDVGAGPAVGYSTTVSVYCMRSAGP